MNTRAVYVLRLNPLHSCSESFILYVHCRCTTEDSKVTLKCPVCYLSWVPGRFEILKFSSMERPSALSSHLSSDGRNQPVGLPPGDTQVRWRAHRLAARRVPALYPDSQVLYYCAALNMAPALCGLSTDTLAALAPQHCGSVARKFCYNTCPVSPCLCSKNHCVSCGTWATGAHCEVCTHPRATIWSAASCLPAGGHVAVMDDGRIINCARLAKVHFIFALEAKRLLHSALKNLGTVSGIFFFTELVHKF